MSYDNKDYPNRKDHLKPYYDSKRFDRTCRCHGSCNHCLRDRTIKDKKNKLSSIDDILELELLEAEISETPNEE